MKHSNERSLLDEVMIQMERRFVKSESDITRDLFFALRAKLGDVVVQLVAYEELLIRWGERINLVSRGEVDFIFSRHICDAFAASLVALVHRQSVITGGLLGDADSYGMLDVGSGAGLPGIVMARCLPESPVVLCEPRSKRCVFLKETARALELRNVDVVNCRLEELNTDSRFCLMITRATGIRETFFVQGSRLLNADAGVAVEMLSASQIELPSIDGPPSIDEWSMISKVPYLLSGASIPRYIVSWRTHR